MAYNPLDSLTPEQLEAVARRIEKEGHKYGFSAIGTARVFRTMKTPKRDDTLGIPGRRHTILQAGDTVVELERGKVYAVTCPAGTSPDERERLTAGLKNQGDPLGIKFVVVPNEGGEETAGRETADISTWIKTFLDCITRAVPPPVGQYHGIGVDGDAVVLRLSREARVDRLELTPGDFRQKPFVMAERIAEVCRGTVAREDLWMQERSLALRYIRNYAVNDHSAREALKALASDIEYGRHRNGGI